VHLLSIFAQIFLMKLFVGGLPLDMDDQELHAIFSDHGKVRSAKIIMDRQTQVSRGFGFVEMFNRNEALAVIEALDRATIEGKAMTVRPADNKKKAGAY
jgi:RNA recognition motif-containing protein